MSIAIGEINKLTVKRETNISYTLTDTTGTEEIFLHFNQTPSPLKVGDKVNAFLYYDQKKRLCATLETPIITTSTYEFVQVVDINNAGVFVNIGIVKDILLSKDYLTINNKFWPKQGDLIPCILKVKSDQLIARIINKGDQIEGTKKLQIGDEAEGIISNISSDGLGIYTKDFDYVFIHNSLIRKEYHLGEKISFTIININKNNEYNGSTIKNKEITRLSDSDYILHLLQVRGGVLQFGNASEPDSIMREFKMSKSAFKRAIGHLYKERLIEISDYRITLITKD